MLFLVDESVRGPIVDGLISDGHAVTRVRVVAPHSSDAAVLELARASGSVLVTADRDFGELLFRHHHVPVGVVFLRFGTLAPSERQRRLTDVVRSYGARLSHQFTVITADAVRVRQYSAGTDHS